MLHVAQMPAAGKDGRPAAEGLGEKIEILRPQYDLVGVCNDPYLARRREIVAQCRQVDGLVQLPLATLRLSVFPVGQQQLVDVVGKTLPESPLEVLLQRRAQCQFLLWLDDIARPVERIHGEDKAGGAETKRCADQRHQFLVR